MFTEDYLMRIINQAIAALMTAIGLRKAGKFTEAQQAVQQAIEQLTTLPANLVDQMDDSSILAMLSAQGQLDIGRLAILADIYLEQGEIQVKQDQPRQGSTAFARALRFILEVTLSEDDQLSIENIGKIAVSNTATGRGHSPGRHAIGTFRLLPAPARKGRPNSVRSGGLPRTGRPGACHASGSNGYQEHLTRQTNKYGNLLFFSCKTC